MKHGENMIAVAEQQPDYMGFIFWEPSKRYFEGSMPNLPDTIKKVGVFVDTPIDYVLLKIAEHGLKAVQLHGTESPEYCNTLKTSKLSHGNVENETSPHAFDIIKVFSIKDDFDFSLLEPYETVCDYFLFDTKGKLPGGNGYTFDWEVLKAYPSTKPYFLSGGIGLKEADKIRDFLQTPASKYCHVIDVNSKFELEPGLKNITALKEFKHRIKN